MNLSARRAPRRLLGLLLGAGLLASLAGVQLVRGAFSSAVANLGNSAGAASSFTPMTITVDTTKSGANARQVTLPPRGNVNVGIDWGGDTQGCPTSLVAANQTTDTTCTYTTDGQYTIKLYGSIAQFGTGNSIAYDPANAPRLTGVIQWGNTGLTSLAGAFYGATNLTTVPAALPGTVTTLAHAFRDATSFNSPNVVTWNTAAVTSLFGTFYNATAFNQPIGSWNTAAVTSLNRTFYNATSFNQPLSGWNTAAVTSMSYTFRTATAFNQPIGSWNTTAVTDMSFMFQGATSFDQPLGTWSTGSVTNMSTMFSGATAFNQHLANWCVTAIASAPSAFDSGASAWTRTRPVWGMCPVSAGPGAPTGVSATALSNTSISVAFVAPAVATPAVTEYTVEWSTSPTFATSAGTVTGASSPIQVTGLSPGTTYYVRVRATNSAGSGPFDSGSTAWAPTALGPALWFDGSDLGSLTTSNGVVSQWNDKSGNSGRNATQAATAQRPALVPNGWLRFTGTQRMSGAMAAGTLPSSMQVTAVYRKTGTNNSWEAFPLNRTAAERPAPFDAYNNTALVGNGSAYAIVSGPNITTRTSWTVQSLSMSGTKVAQSVNGTLTTLGTGTYPYGDNATTFTIASRADGTTQLTGDIRELVVTPELSDVNRQLLEGHLAWKWGLQANLPAGHPYKTAAPGVTHASVLTFNVPTAPTGLTAGDVLVGTLAGSGLTGSTDGTGTAASFSSPRGIAVDAAGTVFVADGGDHVIRAITQGGVVTTLAGLAGSAGTADGTGAAARFNSPRGLAIDAAGNLYVADTGNRLIRKVTPAGAVTTYAGSGASGSADGPALSASFVTPRGIAVDGSGVVYVADQNALSIRRIAVDGTVSTLAGSGGSEPLDGTGTAAGFAGPTDLTIGPDGNLYLADNGAGRIRRITPAGVVTTVSGSAAGTTDGRGANAQHDGPVGIVADPSGTLSVADQSGNRLRRVSAAGDVVTIAGATGAGYADGTGSVAMFDQPTGLARAANGDLYLADQGNRRIRQIVTGGPGTLALMWTAPTNTGGGPITDYLVEVKPSASGAWSTFADGVSALPRAVITGLTPGTAYDVRVSAVNVYGTGPPVTSATTAVALEPAPTLVLATSDHLANPVFCRYACTSLSGLATGSTYTFAFDAQAGSTYTLGGTTIDATSTSWTTGTALVGLTFTTPTSGVSVSGSTITTTSGGTVVATVSGVPGDRAVFFTVQRTVAGVPVSHVAATDVLGAYTTTGAHSFRAPAAGSVRYLLVGGGGGGADNGGGGAGGLLSNLTGTATSVISGTTYSFSVGTGGNAGPNNGTGTSGAATTAFGATAAGGGAGGQWNVNNAASGGSGGGAGGYLATNVGGSGTAGQGNQGGNIGTIDGNALAAGGGGGAGAAGGDGNGTQGGAGGNGLSSPLAGVAGQWYAGGGGGGVYVSGTPGTGGQGGGGQGGGASTASSDGTGNTGGGGGGGNSDAAIGTNGRPRAGGSGVILLRRTNTLAAPAPTGLTVVPGNGQLSVSWTAPFTTGVSRVSSYVVQYRTSPSGSLTLVDTRSTTTSAVITGLTNATLYDVRVAAVNAAGTGTWTSFQTVEAGLAPDSPTSLTAMPSADSQITLSWTAPADNGSAISDYTVQYRAQGAGAWTTFADGTSTATSATVTGLTPATTYEFRVAAVNAVDTGAWSAIATAQAMAAWTPAALSGGSALWLDAADASTITLNGSTVSQWADKSGNARHLAQPTATKQPVLTANQQNGRSGLVFDGSNDSLFVSSSLLDLPQPYTRFVVARFQTKTVKSVVFDSETANIQGVLYNGETSSQWLVAAGFNPTFSSFAYGTADFLTHQHYSTVNGASSAASLDGGTLTAGNAGPSGLPGVRIGNIRAETIGGYAYNGSVFEVLVLPTTLSTTDRQMVEGYLAHKWGLAANLPGGHPYKIFPPLTAAAVPAAVSTVTLTTGDKTMTATWSAPASVGSAITGYDLRYATDANMTGATVVTDAATTTPTATVGGLTSGTTYYVQVRAKNATGTAPWGPTIPASVVATRAWTPADLTGVAMWLDAADASKVVLNGSTVSQWTDKTTNGRDLVQATAENQPTFVSNGFNGLPTLRFDGTNDHFGSRSMPRTGDLNVISVLRPQNKSGDYHNVFDSGASGPMLWVRGSPNVANTWELNTGTGLVSTNTWAGVAQVVGVRVRTATTPYLGIWVNGTSDGSGNGNTGTFANPTNFSFFNRSGAQAFLGDVSEMVWIDGTLTDADRERLEGHLAWKWGLQASLPSGHPHLSAAPLTTNP